MPAFNLALNVASATELLVARAFEVDDGREAALGALWGGAAAFSSGSQQGRVPMNGDASRSSRN